MAKKRIFFVVVMVVLVVVLLGGSQPDRVENFGATLVFDMSRGGGGKDNWLLATAIGDFNNVSFR